MMPVIYPEDCTPGAWQMDHPACNRSNLWRTETPPPGVADIAARESRPSFCIQGKVDPARRNYVTIFREMLEHKEDLLVGGGAAGLCAVQAQAVAGPACACGQPLVAAAAPPHMPQLHGVLRHTRTHATCTTNPLQRPSPQARNFSLVILGKGGGRRDASIVRIPEELVAAGLIKQYASLPFQVGAPGWACGCAGV